MILAKQSLCRIDGYPWQLLAVAIAWSFAATTPAQVATDGTLGPRLTLAGPNYTVPAGIGRGSGPNLFHSFSTLNVRTGESINFLGGSLITNIISRVTGGSPSSINGQISASPGVNLFLLNPSGILFGPGASLNLTASFYASTASQLVFADGSRFASGAEVVPADSLMPFTAPAGFRFDGGRAPITLTGTQLVVRNGATLGLIGGDVQMTNSGSRLSILSVLGGTTAVAATGGSADVALDGRITRGIATGKLETVGGTIIAVNENASGTGSGRIVIRGGDVFFEKAQLLANTRFGNGREIDVEASGLLSLKSSTFSSLTTGRGDAGKVAIRGNDILLEDVSVIDTSCDPGCTTGRGGDIDVRAGRSLVMRNDPALGQQFIASNSFGAGDTGRVTVFAPSIIMSGATTIQAVALASGSSRGLSIGGNTMMLSGGAQVDTSTRGSGAGGPLIVAVQDLVISGDRLDASRQSLPSGFFSNAYSTGFAGSIDISTGNLSVLAGGEISSSSARRAFGNGGAITIRASGNVTISGMSPENKRSSIVSNTFTLADGGTIAISADRIDVLDGGLIQTQSEGSGAAGGLRIVARELNVLGGQISSDARAFGRGGTIDIQLSGALTVARTDPNAFAGIFARTYGPAAGGSIVIRGRSILLRNNGEINAGTIGAGLGGSIVITLSDRLTLNSGGAIQALSDALGDAGNIDIDARGGVELSGAKILTSAKAADGGNIRVVSGGQLNIVDGAEVSAEVKSGTGSGGNVDLQAGTFNLKSARVSASSAGGTGGSVAIRSTGSFAASAATISAQVASGTQSGGNILLSGASLALSGTRVSANAFSGSGGSLRVQSSGAVAFD
ncbi:MAG TPA: filamentous hemagglutinin N-terminal domain-containing protein, partial [Vicinamibacterales bacterium]|nr:filamentous hemagglutinin N-terminal domain-containing protein [Vicinamibacterales bacterium]